MSQNILSKLPGVGDFVSQFRERSTQGAIDRTQTDLQAITPSLMEGVALSTTALTIKHNLGRVPKAVFVGKQTAAADIRWTNANINTIDVSVTSGTPTVTLVFL